MINNNRYGSVVEYRTLAYSLSLKKSEKISPIFLLLRCVLSSFCSSFGLL